MCPRCQLELKIKDGILFCINHGILLRLNDFKNATSKKFSQHFWTFWYKVRQVGGLKCPDCSSRMIVLNSHGKRSFEIDCCGNCFAIWLDKGEYADLKSAYLEFENELQNLENIKNNSDLMYRFGKELVEYNNRLIRYERLTALGKTLTMRIRYRFTSFSGF